MPASFVNVDRDTPMLLPPDLRDWVPEDDLVHFVIEAVNRLETQSFRINERGTGSKEYPPQMMLSLLIYCYAHGIFSSRRIERATYRDVAVRYLSGDTHPDHDTICLFRRKNLEAISVAFVQTLELARQVGVLKIGTVSVDGTHIKANASKDKNVRYDRAVELRQQLQKDIKGLLDQAEQADRNKEDSQKLPEELVRREKLLAKMDRACLQIEQRAKAQAMAEMPKWEHKQATREKRKGRRKGPPARPPSQTPRAGQQINLTDPDAGLMRKSKRDSYTQSYNAQAVVDADGSQLILGQRIGTCASDANELIPSLESIPASLGKADRALADCGYVNREAISEVEAGGTEVFMSVYREDAHAERTYEYRPKNLIRKPKKITDPLLLSMKERLESAPGKAIYAMRAKTVEPVFGIIKQAMGFRQFSLRGKQKIQGEWALVCLAYNLKRLFKLTSQLQTA